MPGSGIKAPVLTELQRQLNHELGAAHGYVAMGAWCELQNLKGFARYFSRQAHEERLHAQRFMKHLLDRGILPVLSSVATPMSEFATLLDVASRALTMEQANTAGIHACFKVALREDDYPAQVLMHWFINEQVEEEDWASEMVDRVQRAACSGGLGDLDRHIERYLDEAGVNVSGEKPV